MGLQSISRSCSSCLRLTLVCSLHPFPGLLTLTSQATDFLFGESTDVLGEGEATARGEKFGDAFGYVTEKIGLEGRVGKLATMMPDANFSDGTKYVHEYVANYVRK